MIPGGRTLDHPLVTRHYRRVKGWADYDLEGTLEVTTEGRSYPVVLPNWLRVSFQEYPEREPPNAKSMVTIFGMTKNRPMPQERHEGWAQLAISHAQSGGRLMPPSKDRCGGVGWHFDLDAVENPRLFRIYVTVPWGEGNSTGGLSVASPLPWVGPPLGVTTESAAPPGGYTLSVTTIEEGRWQWSARSVDRSSPWLERFDLDLSTDGAGLACPPPSLRISYTSKGDLALQAELMARRLLSPVRP